MIFFLDGADKIFNKNTKFARLKNKTCAEFGGDDDEREKEGNWNTCVKKSGDATKKKLGD